MANNCENSSSANIRTAIELIVDEHKIVTYMSLSKELSIHINEAKTLLSLVVNEIKKKNSNIHLNISFLISGLSDNNCGRTVVCPEADLDVQKKAFKTVFFQHIYSVSQGSACVDNAAFASLNKFEDLSLCGGLIKGNLCSKRSGDEIGLLKSNSQKVEDEQETAALSKKEIKDKNSKNVLQNGTKVVKVHEIKSEPTIKTEVISPKKDSSSSSNAKVSAKNGVKKPSKGIAGFLTKSNSVPNKLSTVPKETNEVTVKNEIQNDVKKDSKLDTGAKTQSTVTKETPPAVEMEVQDESMDVDEDIPVKNIKQEPESSKKNKNKKSTSLNQIRKNAKVAVKRKKVLAVSDSESDNDPFADDDQKPINQESDDEIPPTPSINTVKITSGILNPKKRRKIVDKTYTDDEGYILTRKEEVYESCSDEEVKIEPIQVKPEKENVELVNKQKTEVSPKEKKSKNSKKKVSPPQKGKQSNIMSFFKKI